MERNKPEAAKPVADTNRWRQQIRLECLKVASARSMMSNATTASVMDMARVLEKFVIGD